MRVSLSQKYLLGNIVIILIVVFIPLIFQIFNVNIEYGRIIAVIIAVITGFGFGILFSRSFTGELKRLSNVTVGISQGDLTEVPSAERKKFDDEVDDLKFSIVQMANSIRTLLEHLQNTSEKVSTLAQSLSIAAQQFCL